MINKTYILPYKERRRLHERAYRAQQRNHSEVCGALVVGKDRRIELYFIKNSSGRPGHHEIDMEEIKAIRNSIKGRNKRILGIFHSHPVGEAIPGSGDLRGGFYNGHSMIYDVIGREARLWRLCKRGDRKQANEVPLMLEPRRSE
jgi:proteasome lid subunit RPN8/RPN11